MSHTAQQSLYTMGEPSLFGRDRQARSTEATEPSRAVLSQDWRARPDAPQGDGDAGRDTSHQVSRSRGSPASRTGRRGRSRALQSNNWRTDVAADDSDASARPAEAVPGRLGDPDRRHEIHSEHGGDADRRPGRADTSSDWQKRPKSSLEPESPSDQCEAAPTPLISKMGRPLDSIAGMSTAFSCKLVSASKHATCEQSPKVSTNRALTLSLAERIQSSDRHPN